MAAKTVELARLGDIVVEKKYGMTYEEFSEKHLFGNYPVVIGDACKDWSAKNKFTPEYFKTVYGDRKIVVQGNNYTLSEYIDLMMVATEDNPAPYPCKLQIDRDYPELLPDVTPRFMYALPDRITSKLLPNNFLGGADTLEIFFGSPGGQFPYIHYDYMCLHAYITQIYGQKEFTVIPPEQTPYVYPKANNVWVSEVNDVRNPDLEKYPLFAKATPVSFVVGPGETLFIPCGWWHTARSLTATISVALDCLNASNWKNFMNEVDIKLNQRRPLIAKAAHAYLSALGGVLNTSEKIGISV
ncbi:cupin-like domain-containing protein [Spirosoma pollinicola]|uniref:Transcription factor jumonji n=1 Tax=Spirosoma pollinicola TaxID=2057025 RepID=A0A2K8Z961_9BACT|nr:cupin-like domain-containing protein [Spirosoma pollinicola]AUD06407.1 transcription factor jumonji [Spirosoma pollinicola]